MTLDGRPCSIVGVLPGWFDGPAAAGVVRGVRPDIWIPIELVEAGAPRSVPAFDVHARLKPGVTLAQAQAEVDAVMQRLAKEFPQTNAVRGAEVQSIVDRMLGSTRSSLLKERLATLDRDLPATDIAMWRDRVSNSISTRRVTTWLLATFSGTALLLAVIGLYGVMSYSVAQRTREFGVRVALGAKVGHLLQLVVGQGMKLVALGLVFGVLGSLALTRVLSGFLFGVQATDPVTFSAVAALLAVVGTLACWLPARRATKVDPVVALRVE